MDARTRRQVEVEIGRYPVYLQAINASIREYAEYMPIQCINEMPSTAETRLSDPTWRAIERLQRDREYQRTVRIVRALREVLARLDYQSRRVVETYYWRGMDTEDVLAAIGAESIKTLERRRDEIAALTLERMQYWGVATFEE